MKEFTAEPGGRYTYADDVLNLQQLALSLTALFDGCADFVISGCEIAENRITAGYVWLGGKVRYFEGGEYTKLPYYIHEYNFTDTVVYANQINKDGRKNYLSRGSETVIQTPDELTGLPPRFLKITEEYTPRLKDKFFGHYSLLLDGPYESQAVQKNIFLNGKLSSEKEVETATALLVTDKKTGRSFRCTVAEDGKVTFANYDGSSLVARIEMSGNGTAIYGSGSKPLASVTHDGIFSDSSHHESIHAGNMCISKDGIINLGDATDEGAVCINRTGKDNGTNLFRDFKVYDGKGSAVPVFNITGRTSEVDVRGLLRVRCLQESIVLRNESALKGDAALTSYLLWEDRAGEKIANIGYTATDSFDFTVTNNVGNLVLIPKNSVEIKGALKVGGKDISDTYVNQKDFTASLSHKVDKVAGKGLSAEDFTVELKRKLDNIATGSLAAGSEGYATAADVQKELRKKLDTAANLSDVKDKAAVRENLSVYSRAECEQRFLTVAGNLSELVALSADESSGLTAQEKEAIRAQKQSTVRDILDAEKKGVANLKLDKSHNLSDLPDKRIARRNLYVYSRDEIDDMLNGKLGVEAQYTGVTFTAPMRDKLESITKGAFSYRDESGKIHDAVEGYVKTSDVNGQLAGKADRMLKGYTQQEKAVLAANIGVYTKLEALGKFANVDNVWEDYIDFLVSNGKTKAEAWKILRDRLDVLSRPEVMDQYVRRNNRFSDMRFPNADDRKQACRAIGAAYAPDYQPLISDSGWINMNNANKYTDTSNIYIRQIGSVVSIQGQINTGHRDESKYGAVLAVIPNIISPPRYSVKQYLTDYMGGGVMNRGATFSIPGGSRNLVVYENGWGSVWTDINFTYFI